MVAVRSRMLAVWFAAMMLGSTVIVLAAPAAAQTATITVDNVDLLVFNHATNQYDDYSTATFLKAGYRLRVVVAATASCTVSSEIPAVTATVDVLNKLVRSANPSATLTRSGTSYNGVIDFTVEGNFSGTDGIETGLSSPEQTYTVTATSSGCTGAVTGASDTETTPGLVGDTRSPRVSFNRDLISGPQRSPFAPATTAAIGSIVVVKGPLYDELNPTSVQVDFSAFGWGADGVKVSIPTTNSGSNLTWFAINDSALSGKVLNGVATRALVYVTDTAGNVGSTSASTSADITVDNVRPGADSTSFAATRSTLVRNQYREGTAGSGTSYLYANFSSTGDIVPYVRAAITKTATGETVYLHQSRTAATTPRAWTFANPEDNYASAVTVKLTPSDAAGNLASDATLDRTIVFPTMNVAYGPSSASPPAVGGTLLGNVFVNLTSGARTDIVPYETGNTGGPGIFWATLIRHISATQSKYWEVGTKGELEEHFENEQLDMVNEGGGTTADDFVTAFRPAAPLTSNLNIILTNLTGTPAQRSFREGSYSLAVHLRGQDHDLVSVQNFKIDSDDPDLENLAAYQNTIGILPNTNMTGTGVVHGSDGNPFKVAFRVRESSTDATTGALLDSGLRNVTFELFDPATGQVAKHTTTGLPAQVSITPTNGACSPDPSAEPSSSSRTLPYCMDFSSWNKERFNLSAASGGCGGLNGGVSANGPTVTSYPCLTWHDVEWNRSTQHTYVNQTDFSGWVNLTFPDLAAGKYKVRVSAWDFAGLNKTVVYPSGADTYVVAPAVKIAATATSPAVTANNELDVIVAASQRYVTPPGSVADSCVGATGGPSAPGVRDICPAPLVRIYVANNPTASTVGTPLPSSETRTYITIDGTVDTDLVKGFSGARLANGTLVFDQLTPIRTFRYVDNTPPTLTGLGLDLTQDVYVRAEAVSYDSAGNEIVRSTEWVRAASSVAPSLSVVQPPVEWRANLSGDKPLFNITFDRKTESTAPVMRYWLNSTDVDTFGNPTYSTQNDTRSAPRKLNLAGAPNTFAWTGRLHQNATETALPAGAYRMEVMVFQPGATAAEDIILARTVRHLIIVPSTPTIDLLTPTANSGIVIKSPKSVAAQTFEIPFRVTHHDVNLTSLDQLAFKLVTSSNTELAEGDQGFDVTVRADTPLDVAATSSDFTAIVQIPSGGANNDTYQLQLFAVTDPDGLRIGNATEYLTFVYDKADPFATFDATKSEAQVLDITSPTPKRNLASPKPAFIGGVRDNASGPQYVEVRIVDLTLNRTLRLVNTPTGVVTETGVTDAWARSDPIPGMTVPFVQLTPLTHGDFQWTIKLVDRNGLPDLWAADGTKVINLSHQYRIDVRAKDNLSLGGVDFRSYTFDFDGVAPTIGVSALGTTSTMRSGIEVVGATQVAWHVASGAAPLLKVNVTDNQCLEGVYMLAKSDLEPSVVHQAPMTPVGIASTGRVCYDQMPTQANGQKYVQYQLDLSKAPHNFTDHVTNYTYWWKAVDEAGQATEVGESQRTFRMQVVDASPAQVGFVFTQPSTGQVGGRMTIRADIFENQALSHVDITVHDANNPSVVLSNLTKMRAENETSKGWTRYVVDTQDDLGLTLELRDYLVNVTAYDVNWNRSFSAGGPTCPGLSCTPTWVIFRVRDDGAPSVTLESPRADAVLNSTPVLKFRALHKTLDTGGITVRATLDGNASNLTAVPASALNFTALFGANNSRQGWNVTYVPGTLADNATLLVNVTANVGGLVATEQYSFRVDALPPTLASNVTGTSEPIGNKTWALGTAQVRLTATDNVSATTILYTVGAGAETTYTGPITPSGADGEWKLEYYARDAAGNTAPKQTLTLNLDRTGPRISVSRHGDDQLLTVTDGTGVGLNESTVTVHYRYGGSTSFSQVKAEKIAGNQFRAQLPGNATATGLSYYFTALDLLGNQGTNFSATQPHVIQKDQQQVDNQPPTITITAPTPGQEVSGSVELRWTAVDPEQGPLAITITRTDPDALIVAGAENTGRYTLNVSDFTPGAYTVVVTVSDGQNSESAQVTFNVGAPQTIQLARPLPTVATANAQVPIAVAINPVGTTVSRATYSLISNGTAVATGPLTKNAQGVYVATVSANESGTYQVVVDVVYADETTEQKTLGTFAVAPSNPPPITGPTPDDASFPVSLMVLVAIAVVTIALASYGAFGRWRK